MARTCRRPGLGSPLRLARRSGHCSCSLSACLVAAQDCAQQQAGSCHLLEAMGRCIKRVPHRHTLILAGDYNSSVTKQPRLVGPAATFPRGPRPDEPELSNLLGQHRLVALTTWQPLSPHTFVQGDARTQIDFILTREISAGRQAKQASPLLDFRLGSWKKGHQRKKRGPFPLDCGFQPQAVSSSSLVPSRGVSGLKSQGFGFRA